VLERIERAVHATLEVVEIEIPGGHVMHSFKSNAASTLAASYILLF